LVLVETIPGENQIWSFFEEKRNCVGRKRLTRDLCDHNCHNCFM